MLMRILDSIHLTMVETDEEKIAENSPAYLSNILEQDFYGNSDSKGKI